MQGEHVNSIQNLIDNRKSERDAKIARQKLFVDDLIAQFDGTKPFEGIIPTLKRQSIPVGTLNGWQSDADFTKIWSDYKDIRRLRMNDRLFKAIESGEGMNVVAYVMGILNRLDPEFSEKLAHSGIGQISAVTHFGDEQTETPAEVGKGK